MIRKTQIEIAAIAVAATIDRTRPSAKARALLDAIEHKYPGALAKARGDLVRERFDSKFEGDPPAWVKRLVAKHAPGLGRLRWRRSRVKGFSTGRCWAGLGEIVITAAGQDDVEQRYVLLHEIAHYRTHTHHHDDRFWDTCYRLLVEENLYRSALASGHATGSLRIAARRARAKRAARKETAA